MKAKILLAVMMQKMAEEIGEDVAEETGENVAEEMAQHSKLFAQPIHTLMQIP